jgi:hypothetical protein
MDQVSVEIHAERVPPRKRQHIPARLDGRTRIAKRAVQLVRFYTVQLERAGREVTSPEMATAICAAAELVSIAEHARAKLLRGGHVPLDHLAAMQRLADASVARLGLLPSAALAPEAEREQNVEQYLAEYYGKANDP